MEIQLSIENYLSSNLANEYVAQSLAASTRRAYQSDLRHYAKWGGVLPATTEMIIEYIKAFATTLNPSTLNRRIKTIKAWHEFHGYLDPTRNKIIDLTMKGVRKVHGRKLRQTPPLFIEDLIKIVNYLSDKDDFISVRTNALFQIGYFGLFRRSELVNIKFEDLTFSEKGVTIFIPNSKTDQENKGKDVAIPYGKGNLCPVTALKKWLNLSGIVSGYIFIGNGSGRPTSSPHICGEYVVDLIKKISKKCNIENSEKLAGHSFRRGHATSAIEKGVPEHQVMKQGRWVCPKTFKRYSEHGKLYTENSADKLITACMI